MKPSIAFAGTRTGEAGTTLLEIAFALPILLIGIGLYAQIMVTGSGMRTGGQEEWAASAEAQAVLEEIRGVAFRDLFVLYNEDPLDDPGGPGTAPGADFQCRDLRLSESDADGAAGRVVLPVVNGGSAIAPVLELREDIVNPDLGLPRDLNGDFKVDSENHAGDYTMLPIQIEVRWQSRRGERVYRLNALLTELTE